MSNDELIQPKGLSNISLKNGFVRFLLVLSPFWLPLLAAIVSRAVMLLIDIPMKYFVVFIYFCIIASYILGVLSIVSRPNSSAASKVFTSLIYTPFAIFVLFWFGWWAIGITTS